MKNKKNPLVNTGLPSLLVIFIVLCLVTFAVLSYASAMRDYSLAQKTAERTRLYYEADLAAHRCLTALDAGLQEACRDLSGEKTDAFSLVCEDMLPVLLESSLNESGAYPDDTLPAYSIRQEDEAYVCTFYEPLGDAQALLVELSVRQPDGGQTSFFDIQKWQVVSSGSWEVDDSLPVLQEAP